MVVDFGPLIIRLVIGLTFVDHGLQKLFGWFCGIRAAETGIWIESLGIKPGGKYWAIYAGVFVVGGMRIINTLAKKIFKIQPSNGIEADLTSFSLMQGATALGIPVSTTHVVSSAVLGVGSASVSEELTGE
jgi:uncharacterized membrane protein YphA (DoxX/SURF4 family)